MASNPVIWFEIYVQEMARAKAFYEGVLAVELTRLDSPEFEMWAFPSNMEQTGASGALVRYPGMPSGGNSTLVYFACKDCAVEESRVVEHGGRVQRPKMGIGKHGFIALAVDTEGNVFGLHSMA